MESITEFTTEAENLWTELYHPERRTKRCPETDNMEDHRDNLLAYYLEITNELELEKSYLKFLEKDPARETNPDIPAALKYRESRIAKIIERRNALKAILHPEL